MIASTAARRTGDASATAAVLGGPTVCGTAAVAVTASKTSVTIARKAFGGCVLVCPRLLNWWSLGIVRSLTRLRRVRDDVLEAVACGLRELESEIVLAGRMF